MQWDTYIYDVYKNMNNHGIKVHINNQYKVFHEGKLYTAGVICRKKKHTWCCAVSTTNFHILMKIYWFNLQRTFKALQKGCRLMHLIGNKGQGAHPSQPAPIWPMSSAPVSFQCDEERWSPWLTTLIIFHTNRRSIFAQMMCLQPCVCVKWICCQLETSSAVPVCM